MATSLLTTGPITLDPTVYPQSCVSAAATAYAEFLQLNPVPDTDRSNDFEIVILPAFASNGARLRGEFLNYVLDLSIQHHVRCE